MARLYTEVEVRRLIEEATAPLLARIAQLEAQLAGAKKDSSTSSKPPSSDIVKPPRPDAKTRGGRKKKRRRGGQPGHKRHERTLFPPEQVDKIWCYEWAEASSLPEWEALDEYQTVQQVELLPKLFEVIEHRARLYRHRVTGQMVVAAMPDAVRRGGLGGPRLSSLIAYQKGACHMTYRVIQTFLRDVLQLDFSTGQLVKIVGKARDALLSCYEQLETALPTCTMVNIDETGHPENGQRLWTWGFHVPGPAGFTLFHIDTARSSDVLKEFLGETFTGVVGCDYHSAYRKFLEDLGANMQFCWAHLIRDVKYLTTLPDRVTRGYGERLLAAIKQMFRAWHQRDIMRPDRWRQSADRVRREVLKVARRPPSRREAQNIAKRFRKYSPHYFRFLDTPGVEPTNNAMEQRFRFVVIDRKITQGTRGPAGRSWCERIWTVLATCAQRGRSAFHFLEETMDAFFAGRTPPTLEFDSS
jgi:transposase